MILRRIACCTAILCFLSLASSGRRTAVPAHPPLTASEFDGLQLRALGPAMISGRVSGFAVDPRSPSHFYVAEASGGVWKTENDGATWTPVFDHEGSYSIGAIALDPRNPDVVWVGTGEGNSQRSVSYGDGVYRSEDGGRTWKKMGLDTSQHIGRIVIDPRHPDTVYVAAEGSLWGSGGDRGLFKTTDAGKTWTNILKISPDTGVADVALDPAHPDLLFAAAYERRRRFYGFIDGGPESALYRSTDAGKTWTKLSVGLPKVDLGRIGVSVSPVDPAVIYAVIEAASGQGGVFRSTDYGVTWQKRNPLHPEGMYYGQIIADPHSVNRLYVLDMQVWVSDDGGQHFRLLPDKHKHPDNHALWIDPADPQHYLSGCDGGVYETRDAGRHWQFKRNLPTAQFYDVAVDQTWPFFHVYGGTQDNNSVGGPANTQSISGITDADWFVTAGGDGFHSAVDPQDPQTVYAESQYGGLERFDRHTGDVIGIQPQLGAHQTPLRWQWDAPVVISPFDHRRLYFAANRLYQSDDRGGNWRAISGDLSRGLDPRSLPLLGHTWGPDAVTLGISTSFYGAVTALAESPLRQGLIYAGTDDGLIQITSDDGAHWTKIAHIPGVPANALVSRIVASRHDADTVYAALVNYKNNDFKPYLLKSADAGTSWTSIAGTLPANGPVWALAEDPVNPRLLFAGTEFGLFFTIDGGAHWTRLKGNLPVIAVRDLVIQKPSDALVAATFGRGIYVLDDIAPLRALSLTQLQQPGTLFPVDKAALYQQGWPLGDRGAAAQGDAFFTAPNRPLGAIFTYFLRDSLQSQREVWRKQEAEAEKKRSNYAFPTPQQLHEAAEEPKPEVDLVVSDAAGHPLRILPGDVSAGMHRVVWDLRRPAPVLVTQSPDPDNAPQGPLVMPGTYQVTLVERVHGAWKTLSGPQKFAVVALHPDVLTPPVQQQIAAFQQKLAQLQNAVTGAVEQANDMKSRLQKMQAALVQTPAAERTLSGQALQIRRSLDELRRLLEGDDVLRAHFLNTPPSIQERVATLVGNESQSLQAPTQADQIGYNVVAAEFQQVLTQLKKLDEVDLAGLQKALQSAGAPWTPGALPVWPAQSRQ